MGMGSAPAHAWVISKDNLRALLPAYVAFEALLSLHDKTVDDYALSISKDELLEDVSEEDNEAIDKAWGEVEAAFKTATTVGESSLELDIGYYNREEGDLYDDLEDGAYFTVDNVLDFTPAGNKFKDKLENASWTIYG